VPGASPALSGRSSLSLAGFGSPALPTPPSTRAAPASPLYPAAPGGDAACDGAAATPAASAAAAPPARSASAGRSRTPGRSPGSAAQHALLAAQLQVSCWASRQRVLRRSRHAAAADQHTLLPHGALPPPRRAWRSAGAATRRQLATAPPAPRARAARHAAPR
jgi:hypothetical protein